MRKLLIIVCLLSTVFIAFGQKKKKKRDKEAPLTVEAVTKMDSIDYKSPGAPMPTLRVKMKDSTFKRLKTEKDYAKYDKLLIMMFNPTCEHCQEETTILQQNIAVFKKSKILLLAAPAMDAYMDFFEAITNISKFPAIEVGMDSAGFIDKTFTYQSLPQINIYDNDRKLLKIFTGTVPIDSLKQYME